MALPSLTTRLALAALFLSFASLKVGAQTFPDRPLTIIVPYQAGTIADLLARGVGDELAQAFKQPVVVDNRPGAGQVVGSVAVSRAAPNGYTIMITAIPTLVAPSIQKTLPYADAADFAGIAHVAAFVNPVMVSPTLPATNLQEFIALLKANPGKYKYGSSGIGAPNHLFAEMFNRAAGTKSLHVPYKSFQTALTDIMSGEVDYGFMSFSAMQFVNAGKLKVLATPGPQRDADFPNVPTIAEQGVKGFESVINYMMVAPKGTAQPIVERLNSAINSATASPTFANKIRSVGGVSVLKPMKPAQVNALMASEQERWLKFTKEQNISLE